MASAHGGALEFLTYQLPMIGHLLTLALAGTGEVGIDTGEGA